MDKQASQQIASLSFEREKWEAEQRRLDKEFSLRERELHHKELESRRARLGNPLALAIIAASVAAGGNVLVSWENGKSGIQLETFKAESARILEVVKTGNPDEAAKNLQFLLAAGLIQTPKLVANIKSYLSARVPGQGVSLPLSGEAQKKVQELLNKLTSLGFESHSVTPPPR